MRSFGVRRLVAFLPLIGLALGVLFAPRATAENNGEFSCTPEMFKGSYMWTRDGAKVTEDKISHPLTTVGLMRPDGEGRIPFVARTRKDARSRAVFDEVNDEAMGTSTGFSQKWGEEVEEFDRPANRWEYSIESNCRGIITATNPNGRVTSTWRFVLTNGGRDGMLTGAGGGIGAWIGQLNRIDNADQDLEDRVVRIEKLLELMAWRLNITTKPE